MVKKLLDEKKIIKVKYRDKELELKADFKAFKKLNKLTGNAFLAVNQFSLDADSRLELLPTFIQAMCSEDLTLEEIEEEILGLNYVKVMQTADIVFSLLNLELSNEVETEEKMIDESEKKLKKTQKKKK